MLLADSLHHHGRLAKRSGPGAMRQVAGGFRVLFAFCSKVSRRRVCMASAFGGRHGVSTRRRALLLDRVGIARCCYGCIGVLFHGLSFRFFG